MNKVQFGRIALKILIKYQVNVKYWHGVLIDLHIYSNFLSIKTYLLDWMTCSLPLLESLPQCKWNWTKSYRSANPPPVMYGILSLEKSFGKLYKAVIQIVKWGSFIMMNFKNLNLWCNWFQENTSMSVVSQQHVLKFTIIVKRKFGVSCQYGRLRLDVDRWLLFTATGRVSCRPSTRILKEHHHWFFLNGYR